MIAIGQKHRPSVRIECRRLAEDFVRQRRGAGTIRVYSPERAACIGGINNYAATAPASSARVGCKGKDLWCAARCHYFLHIACGEKCDVEVIRRPKRITCSPGVLQPEFPGRADALHAQHSD